MKHKCTTEYAHLCKTDYAQVHLDEAQVHNRLRRSAPIDYAQVHNRLRASEQVHLDYAHSCIPKVTILAEGKDARHDCPKHAHTRGDWLITRSETHPHTHARTDARTHLLTRTHARTLKCTHLGS
jgi:hypothetical protein